LRSLLAIAGDVAQTPNGKPLLEPMTAISAMPA
jgi:hypothetical protein